MNRLYFHPARILLLSTAVLCGALAPMKSSHGQIDKIYHPYVNIGEREIEFRSVYADDDNRGRDDYLLNRLAFGYGLTERFALEAYLVGEKTPGGAHELTTFEVEGLLQLTEQGEYWADWGLLLELEKARRLDAWATSTTLIVEKELGQWSATANLGLEYEFGSDTQEEWESLFAGQMRYRHSERFEPGVEIYAADETRGLGPVLMGTQRLGLRKLNWEFGIIAGINGDTPDMTLRFLIDYEF